MSDPIIGMRFSVQFLVNGAQSNSLDIRFQKVSGLGAQVETETIQEGGQNLYTQQLPKGVKYNNLVLERGMVVRSPLNRAVEAALAQFKFLACNVLVSLLGDDKQPLAAWLFHKAYPVRWSTSDLSAADAALVIDTLELTYTRMQIMQV